MTKAEMDQVWRTVQRIAVPLLTALIIGIAGFMLGNREELHAQDKRLVRVEATVPSMVIVEERFSQILVEMQGIKGDVRVILTQLQALRDQYESLCRRVERLEQKAHEGD